MAEAEGFQARSCGRRWSYFIAGLATSFYVWLVLATTIPYPGRIGLDYNTLGTDWMVFYGRFVRFLMVTRHRSSTAIDLLDFSMRRSRTGSRNRWIFGSAHPPGFLLLLLPFAPLGFFGSYLAFQVATAGLRRSRCDRMREAGGLW